MKKYRINPKIFLTPLSGAEITWHGYGMPRIEYISDNGYNLVFDDMLSELMPGSGSREQHLLELAMGLFGRS